MGSPEGSRINIKRRFTTSAFVYERMGQSSKNPDIHTGFFEPGTLSSTGHGSNRNQVVYGFIVLFQLARYPVISSFQAILE